MRLEDGAESNTRKTGANQVVGLSMVLVYEVEKIVWR
jgi:hypothetical protein